MKRLLLAAAMLLLLAVPTAAGTVVEIRLNDIVHSVSAEYLLAGLEHADKINADAVLIWINTPGGLETSMREMVDHITASKVPVIVYVAPTGGRAASAGFFILLAADVAIMAPGTTTGASSPVAFGGGDIDETLKKKITNDAAAYLRSYASKRNRNPALAELAVTEAKSFTDQEALEGKLIDAVCESRDQIFAQFNTRAITRFDGSSHTLELADARVEPWDMTGRQRFLSRLIDPNIAFLLLVFGILGLYIEFNHPGFIVPGVAGGISLVLALFALHLLPVNYAAVLLIVLSVVMFILEAVYVSHGVLAVGGVIAMVLGALMLIDAPPIPELRVRWEVALSVAIPFAVLTVVLLRLVLRSRKWGATIGPESLVGAIGEVRQAIEDGQKGLVHVAGELWTARSGVPLAVGQQIRVVAVEGLTLHVEPVGAPPPPVGAAAKE